MQHQKSAKRVLPMQHQKYLTFATTCLGMLLLGSYCVHWGEYRIPAKQGLLQYHQNSATKDLGTLVLNSYFQG